EQPVYAVAVVVIVLGGVDATLSRDGVCTARGILKTEAFDVVTEFRKGRRRGSARQAGSHHQNGVLALVGRIHQLEMESVIFPPLLDRSRRRFGVKLHSW